jgi:hypothetical protein
MVDVQKILVAFLNTVPEICLFHWWNLSLFLWEGGVKSIQTNVLMCWFITLFRLQDDRSDRSKGTLLCVCVCCACLHTHTHWMSRTVKISQDFLKKQNTNLNLCNLQQSHLYLIIIFSFTHYWHWLAFYARSWWGHVHQVIWYEQQQNLMTELTEL